MKWPLLSIGEVCVDTEQRDPREQPDEYFCYVDIASIDREVKRITELTKILGKEAPSRARKAIQVDDVLVSTIRPNLNAVAIVLDDLDGEIASTGFCVLRADRSRVDARYLFYCVRSQYFIQYLSNRVTGANYPAVTDKVVKEAPLPLPPLDEQRRIVRLLDEAEALRQLRARADQRMVEFIPALFNQMFGDPVVNPKHWKQVKLKDLVADLRGGSPLEPEDFLDQGFPVLHKGAIKPFGHVELDPKKRTFTHEKFVQKYSRSVIDRSYVVVTLRDLVPSGPSIGLMSRLQEYPYPQCILAQGIYGLSVDEERVSPDYLVYLSNIESFRRFLKTLAVGSTQIHIRTPIFTGVDVPLPPISLQREFASRVAEVRALQKRQAHTRSRLDDVFQSLLHRAFTGEL